MAKFEVNAKPVLSKLNSHPRDKNIRFYARGHKYEIITDMGSKYTSVTTWNHSHFPKFDADAVIKNIMKGKNWKEGHKYWGMTADEIKTSWNKNRDQVAGAGTDLHALIEDFMNNEDLSNKLNYYYKHEHLYENYISNKDKNFNKEVYNCPEWNYFIKFVEEHSNLTPYRTEWMIYHEDVKIAGSIDMIYLNDDGTLSIYDWKRSKEITKTTNWEEYALNPLIYHLPNTNFWHYALQLNTYKKILEDKYGRIVKNLYLVRLHPETTTDTYELLEVPILTKEINDLFEERKEILKRQKTT
jgi:CRISPR/Cas system-associated exonuclease Cas4 (RecB family)